ncbi:hypothetical protein D8B26_003917 [Coccidioides posadasii str. Silveira]|uniref:Uncharacterized protein n=1 Tax=Coccidioides posadasii (strain RMSCC 757 / Silveira) TaxID=443226 RepID=E9D9D6_COCPS|nr:conserved hypothetical protein [Coccidioides posadasii str. Silveira]QVM09253.1 hypothetical protein D8B26_003917 [Coccidioides posadasii str. Silveira]
MAPAQGEGRHLNYQSNHGNNRDWPDNPMEFMINGAIRGITGENDQDFVSQIGVTENIQPLGGDSNNEDDCSFVFQNGVPEDNQSMEINSQCGEYPDFISQVDPSEYYQTLGSTSDSDDSASESSINGQPNHSLLNCENLECTDDSNFGDIESNGDTAYDTESLWNESDGEALTASMDGHGNDFTPRDRSHNRLGGYQGLLLSQIDLGFLGEDDSDSLTTDPLASSDEDDYGEISYDFEEITPIIRNNSFVRRMENRRLPSSFDPDIVFDDDSDSNEPHDGPFLVQGQIWEDPSSDELNSFIVAQGRAHVHEQQPASPLLIEEGSDENKENIPPQRQVQSRIGDNRHGNEPNTVRGTRGRFDPVQSVQHHSFGPLRPVAPWPLE